jgi:hypothetical protein
MGEDIKLILGKEIVSYLPYIKWIPLFILLFLGFFVIFSNIRDKRLLETVTKTNRGTRTERELVLKLLKQAIPSQVIFHDLYLKKPNGGYSQIDLVVAAKAGIIVFEVKDYSGWIFGNGQYREWTQVLAYGKEKYRFYNPIMQNNKHLVELRKKLKQSENIPFYSIVVFYGDCVLKDISFVPDGTFLVKSDKVLEVLNIILTKNELAMYSDKFEVFKVLKEAVYNGNIKEIQTQHIANVKNMLGKHRIFN